MTERACHVFGYATQVGLTQALDTYESLLATVALNPHASLCCRTE